MLMMKMMVIPIVQIREAVLLLQLSVMHYYHAIILAVTAARVVVAHKRVTRSRVGARSGTGRRLSNCDGRRGCGHVQ
jgi:hypothetical protein